MSKIFVIRIKGFTYKNKSGNIYDRYLCKTGKFKGEDTHFLYCNHPYDKKTFHFETKKEAQTFAYKYQKCIKHPLYVSSTNVENINEQGEKYV